MTIEPEQQIGVGTQDAFQRLWTPHRMAYIQGENKPTGPGADDGCPFCSIPAKSDEDGLVIARGEKVYVVLNLYPYNGGHLMVVPYRHVRRFDWSTVGADILAVYETVTDGAASVATDERTGLMARFGLARD